MARAGAAASTTPCGSSGSAWPNWGLPKDQVRQILPVTDMQRRPYVRLGTWTVDSAEKLLDALTRAPEQVP